jgi:hypothetical protein
MTAVLAARLKSVAFSVALDFRVLGGGQKLLAIDAGALVLVPCTTP